MLPYHPHIHYIVPAGGVSEDRKKWITARNSFYLPVRALSKIYRAKFKAEMEKLGLIGQITPTVWNAEWIVNCQVVGSPEASLKYLAPYVFRVAISDNRIIAVKNRQVTFSYRKSGSRRLRKMTLDVMAFIGRFLQHVLPSGFMKVRHYGFMNGSCAIKITKIRQMIIACLKDISLLISDEPRKKHDTTERGPYCSGCGGKLVYLFSFIPGRPCRGGPI